MNKVRLGTYVPTKRDVAKSRAVRPRPEIVDWDELRTETNSRMFVGPPAPAAHFRDRFEEAGRSRYWRFVDDIRRYGHIEFSQKGTPFLGDVFGY